MEIDKLREMRAAGIKRIVMSGDDVTEAEFFEMSDIEKTEASVAMSEAEAAMVRHLTGKTREEIEHKIQHELLYGSSV